MLYRAMDSVMALERLQIMQGTTSAIASAFGKAGELPASIKADMRDAYLAEG